MTRTRAGKCRMSVEIAPLESRSFVSRSAAVQKSVRSRHSRRMVPIRRSTNGCESGTYGTVLIASTSRIRRFACHWWNRYRGSWSELRYVGGVWHRVARLNIRHSPTPSIDVNHPADHSLQVALDDNLV